MLDEPKKFTYVSTLLSSKEREQIQGVLLKNLDVFAWSHLDMVGIDPILASNKLNLVHAAKPVRQKVRRFHPNCHQNFQIEVDNLLKAGFIREIKYLKWLANVVVIPNKGGKWIVCVDYTDLNEACPKDSFPLPHIDQIVDATARHGILSFMDAFFGYHWIPMHLLTQRKRLSLHRTGYTITM